MENKMENKKFEWTDELVAEYGDFYKSKQGVDYTTWGKCIMDAFKESKKKIILTTQDGVSYFNKEYKCYRVITKPSSFELWKPIFLEIPDTKYDGEYYFSNKVAADKFILENKPTLSINDIFEWYDKWYCNNAARESIFNGLKELAKQKVIISK